MTIPPIVCDMTGAPDSAAERIAAYAALFRTSLVRRERDGDTVRFVFRAAPGVEEWVRELAAREGACCAFFTFSVAACADEVWWDASVPDDDLAHRILEEWARLPDTALSGADAVEAGFVGSGLRIVGDDRGPRPDATERGAVAAQSARLDARCNETTE